MTPNPIACTLSSTERVARGDEWSNFLETDVEEQVRSGTFARLRLRDTADVILTAVDLARREKECCAFFEFRLDLRPDAVWLEVEAPAEATPILEALVARRTD